MSGISKISSIPGSGARTTLKWDSVEQYGGWTSTNTEFTVPAAGFYFLTADLTALSPKSATPPPALQFSAMATEADGTGHEWFRSYNSTIVPGTYVTLSLRGIAYAGQGDRISLTASTRPGTGAWEISPGSHTSGQMNNVSAILIAPGATHY
ncbi:cadherin repeat domain-containing protein [Streptomyces rimosus]|uniref:hypothetical protein n=1 Tax=Streptomyces rimosus TaxID=1927 RepID=UPI000A80220B|nr:hypothetical protein [Streptomyces rimosus]